MKFSNPVKPKAAKPRTKKPVAPNNSDDDSTPPSKKSRKAPKRKDRMSGSDSDALYSESPKKRKTVSQLISQLLKCQDSYSLIFLSLFFVNRKKVPWKKTVLMVISLRLHQEQSPHEHGHPLSIILEMIAMTTIDLLDLDFSGV